MIDVSTIAPNLSLGADGIWYGADGDALSYPAGGNEACFQIENSSFWFNHRNACILAAVRNFPPREGGPIFDIGGGNGFVSIGLLRAGFDTVLVEPGPVGASNGKKCGLPTVICATTIAAGFRNATLDAVGLFDVIEHLQDDDQFLTSIHGLLKPGGRLYATVPAYPALWSKEDELAGHFRRYTCKSIGALMERTGFKIEYSTYIFRPLPLPILLFRSLPYRLEHIGGSGGTRDGARDHRPVTGIAAGVVRWVFNGEVANIASKRRMAFGGSCLVVAHTT
jgi:SAM-dependent methyltransferase